MNHSDEATDRVLAGLRNVQPAEGMERRILAAVHQRAAAPRTMPLRWFAVGGFALATAAVIAIVLSPRRAASPAPAQTVVQARAQPEHSDLPPEPEAPVRPRRHTPAIRANAEAPVMMASFPAPPMPLTEQERLLVQVAQRGAPAALPVLDPDALAQQEARSEQVLEAALASAKPPTLLFPKEDLR